MVLKSWVVILIGLMIVVYFLVRSVVFMSKVINRIDKIVVDFFLINLNNFCFISNVIFFFFFLLNLEFLIGKILNYLLDVGYLLYGYFL